MDEKIKEQATFSGVCNILKDRKKGDAYLKCLFPMVKLLATVIPGMAAVKELKGIVGDIAEGLEDTITVMDAGSYYTNTIGEAFRVLWHPGWRVRSLYLDQIWSIARDHGIKMVHVYRACPSAVEQMCAAEIEWDDFVSSYRLQRIHELLDQCPTELQLRHLRSIKRIADQQKDTELQEKRMDSCCCNCRLIPQPSCEVPRKVRQICLTQIVQAARRACCLCNAGGKPFVFAAQTGLRCYHRASKKPL